MEEIRISVTPLLPHLGQLADLHVYVVPVECWASSQKLLCSYVMQEAISYGFVRVQTQVTLHDLRSDLEEQLEKDVLPKEYVFLKSVGRNFARVKDKQEYQLKVRDFVPPSDSVETLIVMEVQKGHPQQSFIEKASEPELYLLEIIPEVDGNQTDKLHNRGRTRLELVSPSLLPTLASPVNDLSQPSGVVSGSPTTILLPPVSPSRAKVTGVSGKNRATSSTGLVAVDPEVKFPSIQIARPKSESQAKTSMEPKNIPKKATTKKQISVIPKPPPLPPPIPPPLPPLHPPPLPSRIPISRTRNGKGPTTGRRVSVTANVLKKRHYPGNGRASAIIAHQRISVPNGRKLVARGTALSDVAEESEGAAEIPLQPMRVEGPEKMKQRTSYYANNYRAVQKVLDSPQESTDEDLTTFTIVTGDTEDEKSEDEKATFTLLQDDDSPLEQIQQEVDYIDRPIVVIGRSGRRRSKVSSSGILRPVSCLDIRSAERAAILKYELTVSELKDLRHAACHTSEQTSRPIMYRRNRPIPRTVWYPRPLHEGGNPPPVLRKTVYRRGRRSKAVRGDAGHAYYTSSTDRRRVERPHVTFGTRGFKKKMKTSPVQGARQKNVKVSPAFQVIQAAASGDEKRPPYSKSKKRKKRIVDPVRVDSGVVEEEKIVTGKEVGVAITCEKANGGCCDWVIDNISLEEFTNSEEKRKQVLQPIRKAAQAKRQQVEKEAMNKYKSRSDVTSETTVLLCSVDKPH